MDRKVIEAPKGMILTNETTYGKKIYLADNVKADEFKEITEEEYNEILKEEENVG